MINGIEETAVLSDKPEETVIVPYGEEPADDDGFAEVQEEPEETGGDDAAKPDEAGFVDVPEEQQDAEDEPKESGTEELSEPDGEEEPAGDATDDDLFEAFLETGNADAAVRKTRVIDKKEIEGLIEEQENEEVQVPSETLTVNKDELYAKEHQTDTIVFETDGKLPESMEEVLSEDAGGDGTQGEAASVQEEDPGYHDIDREHRFRIKKHPFLYGSVLVLAVIGVIAFMMSPFFNIKGTVVEGNMYYSDEEVANIAGVQTGKNIFIYADKDGLKENLMKDPYFADVSISRRLPSTIKIKVTEREQIACIVYGNEFVVIDVNGIVLRKTNVDPKQTTLTGLTISKMTKGEAVEVEETRTLQHMLEMLASMKNGDFYFKHIEIDGRNVNAYITDMLMVKGRADELKRAVDEGDLQKVVNNLLQDDIRRGTITLSDDEFMSFSPKIG